MGMFLMMFRNNVHKFQNIALLSAALLQVACGGAGSDQPDAGVQHQDLPIAYVKRPTPRDDVGAIIQTDIREPSTFNPGGDLYLKARASAGTSEQNITGTLTQSLGDVKDIEVNYEGTKLIFSLRQEDDNVDPDETWSLYEYDLTTKALTPVFTNYDTANEGHDIAPAYLPDGRIIFSSTRQEKNQGLLLDEGKPQYSGLDERRRDPAFVLHVIDFDGTVKQISFNQSHDLDPMVLQNSGRILFSRWNNMGSQSEISLYTMNPDGTDVQMHYGSHSHNTGTNGGTVHFLQPRETSDNNIVAIIQPFTGTFSGGDIIQINTNDYADNTQGTWLLQEVVSGPAQTVITQNVTSGNVLSLGGRFGSIYALGDGSNRTLVSWNQCQILSIPTDPTSTIIPCTLATPAQLNDPNLVEAPPAYGVYLMDFSTYNQIPVVIPEADTLVTDVVAAFKRTKPTILFDKVPGVDPEIDTINAGHNVGVLHIRSVYDFDENFNNLGTAATGINSTADMADPTKTTSADQRPARFIRIIKAVSIPGRNTRRISNTAFGVSTQQGMREILGYAPIEPDGSVKIKVPSDVPFTFSILDKEGRRIRGLRANGNRNNQRHQYWLQLKAGETLECVGCHYSHDGNNPQDSKPHGRPLNQTSKNTGAATTGLAFPNSEAALWAEMGETMAEAKARHSCNNTVDPNDPCPEMKLSPDLIYSDIWTDDTAPANVAITRIKDATYSYTYAALTTAIPTSSFCSEKLEDKFSLCRIVINYDTHIEPLWSAARGAGGTETCISCHNQATNLGLTPVGQLDLVSPAKANPTEQFNSFNELFRSTPKFLANGDIEQTQLIINGVPQFNLDVNGDPDPSSPIMVNVTVPGVMTPAGARASYFMEKITNTELDAGRALSGTTDHSAMMTASELKLISEWLDIGAQYFNNPFDAPTN